MTAGNSLEQSVALVAAANKVVQDPNSVGSALRTISLRLRGTSVEILEEMGEETEGVVESTSKLQEKLKALTGVDILTDDGAYKDTYTILKEIANVWDDLSDMDKAAALELMAGKNRANTLSAILTNVEDLEAAYLSALDAEGSAFKENQAYLDSIQGKLDLFTNSVQVAWSNIISSDLIKGIVDAGTTLVKTFGNIPGVLTAIAGALALIAKIKMYDEASLMGKWLRESIPAVKTLTSSLWGLIAAKSASTKASLVQSLVDEGVNGHLIANIVATAGLKKSTGSLTREQIKNAKATLAAKLATGELTIAQYSAAMSSLKLKSSTQDLGKVLASNKIFIIAAIVAALALALDHLHITVEEAAEAASEAFEEMRSVVDETKSSIQSLEGELSILQSKIDELEGKNLSFTEEEELKRLKKQRGELERSLKIQEQLLESQQGAYNKRAVAAMKAYTKASSAGAEKTQKAWTNALTALGVVAGGAAVIASGGTALIPILAGAAAGGVAGNKLGEVVGSNKVANDGTYDSWYETYTKALDAAQEKEQEALEKYEKDTSNIKKLEKWQEAQEKTTEIETEMYDHLSQMQSYYNGLEYGKSAELDNELDTWYNFLDKFNIDQGGQDAKVNAIERLFGENASEEVQWFAEEMKNVAAIGEAVDFTEADAETLGLADTLEYLGITVQDVENYFDDAAKAAEEAAASASKFADAITEIASAENALKALSSAMEEFSQDGSVSASTLDGFDDKIKGLGDVWDDYVEVMLSGNASMADAYRVTTALVEEFLENNINELTAENKLGYIAQLEKLGVENAKELIDSYVNNDFFNSSAIDQQAIAFKKWSDEIDNAADSWNDLTNGNVDYNNRPVVSKQDLVDAGWDASDISDDDIVTTYTSGYSEIKDANGKKFSITVTPILDNGEVLSPEELNSYVNDVLSGSDDILAADEKGIVVHINQEEKWDEAYWNDFESSLLDSKNKHAGAVNDAAQGLIDLAAEHGIVLDLADAYDILRKKEQLATAEKEKYAAERANAVNEERKAAEKLKEEILDADYNISSTYEAINDIKNRTGAYASGEIYGNESDEWYKQRLESFMAELEFYLAEYGYTLEDLFAETELIPVPECPSDAEIEQYRKELQAELDKHELTISPKIDLNPQDVIEDLSDIEGGFEAISEVYNEFLEKGVVSAGSLAGLKETFDIAGVSDEYEAFIAVLGNSNSTIEQVKSAILSLANAYLNTVRITDELTEAEKNLIVEQLKRLGVINAKEWVESRVEAYRDIWETYEIDLNNYDTVEEAKLQIFANAIAAQLNIENELVLDLVDKYGIDLSNFTKTANGKIKVAKDAALKIAQAYANAEMAGEFAALKGLDPSEQAKQEHILLNKYNNRLDEIQREIEGIELIDPEVDLDRWYKSPDIQLDYGTLGGLSDSSSAEDTAEQTVDFIEIKLEEIEKIIAKSTARIENIIDNAASAAAKRAAYDDAIAAQKEKARVNNSAASYYNQKAASLLSEAPSQYREMAKNGAISVKDFVGEDQTEIAEAIEKYREYDSKADDAEIAALEAIAEVSALRLEMIKDIADDFDNVIGLIDSKSNLLQSNMDLVEESGIRMSEAYYDELIKGANDTIAQLEQKQAGIRSDLNAAVASGEIAVGSDDWYEAVNLILECDEAILDCKQSTEEWNNAINELKWENLDKFITELDNVDSQISHLYDLLSEDDQVVDDMGNWTNEGITSLGLLAQQMELAQYRSQQYAKAIQELEADYADGRYSTDEYNEKLAELTEGQWESIEAYEQAKDAIVDLNKVRVDAVKDGIQKEIDAYKKLIDAKKEALDIDKEAHEFERDVAEKQKNIGVIQRQLAAIANNNSAEANAKRKQLQAELLKANSELEEFYYDKSIEDQKNALDKEYENYEQNKQEEMDALDEWLKNQEVVIQESFDLIKANAETVLATIKDTASEYGVQISEAITEPWRNGETAISDYNGAFNSAIGNLSSSVDAFIGKLNELLAKQNEIIESANNMANSVIDSTNQSFANATESQNTTVNGWDSSGSGSFGDISGGGFGLSSSGSSSSGSNIQVGGRIHAGNAPIYENINGIPEKQTFDEDPIYNVLKEKGDWIQVRWHKAKSGVSGWFKKGDVNAYAKGTLGTKKDELALIDELGEELQLIPNGQGRLEYLKKGTSVIPAHLTERLMEWGELDPTEALNQSKPKLGLPHITTNNFNIDLSFGSLVHVDAVSNDTLPELQKMVRKEFDGLMKGLNNGVKRYTR